MTPTCSAKNCPMPIGPKPPEHGPCLTSGIIAVGDTSFTTRVRVHSGSAPTTRYITVALLDTGSPQSFITADAVETMKACCAATHLCEQHGPPRSWGGFGTSAPLTTSASIRLSVQFLRRFSPTAALAVWACIVPPGTMQHPIVLGRDSWMRFEQRSYTTLPHQLPEPTLGELSRSHYDPDRASAFIPDDRSPHDIYHLRYAGAETISLSAVPTRVNVNLARRSGASVFTRNYVDNMIPRDDFLGDTEMFVSDAYQTIRDSGSTNLDPDDFLRISPSPLVQACLLYTSPSPRD